MKSFLSEQQPPPPPPPSKKMKRGPSHLGTSSSTEKGIRVLLLGDEGSSLNELHVLLLEKGFKVTVFSCPTEAIAFFGMEFPAEPHEHRASHSSDPVVVDSICDACLVPFSKHQAFGGHKAQSKVCRGTTIQTMRFDATSEEKIVETGYKTIEKVAMHSKKMKCGVDMIIVNELVLAKHATGKPPVTAVDIVGAMRESSMNLPVVVVTDSNDDEALARCLAGGVIEVIKKPITGDQVVDLKKYLQE